MPLVVGTYDGILYGMQLKEQPKPAVTEEDEFSDGGDEFDADGGFGKPASANSATAVLETSFVSEAHIGNVRAVAGSASGQWLVSGGSDEAIRILNMATRREFGQLYKHNGAITCLRFFSDSHLFSASEDGLIMIWECVKWTQLAALKGHKGAVNDLSIHPSGKVALSVGKDCTFRMWDLVKGKQALKNTMPKEGKFVQWSMDGSVYVVGYDQDHFKSSVNVYTKDGKLSRIVPLPVKLNCITFLSETVFATGTEDGVIRFWDTSTGESTHEIHAHTTRVRALVPCKGEGGDEALHIASIGSDGSISVWKMGSSKPIATTKNAGGARLTTLCNATTYVVTTEDVEGDKDKGILSERTTTTKGRKRSQGKRVAKVKKSKKQKVEQAASEPQKGAKAVRGGKTNPKPKGGSKKKAKPSKKKGKK